ncbi:MAG: tetratricopeptide repeat protein [Myxococcales bacterium]|nr:tetratricopeptide repeat protein [Myxococcales bacterium]
MSELRSALVQYLRALDDPALRSELESAVGDIDLVTARADAKKDPASVEAAAAVLGRLVVDSASVDEIVDAAKHSAQRAPRNDAGNDIALLAGLVVWKVGQQTDLAEPFFRRIRRSEPANLDVLGFYREVFSADKDASQLMQVLVQARRSLKKDDVDRRFELAEEMAEIAEQKLGSVDRAIEVWRSVLREDGHDDRAVSALQRLYREGQKWTALVELLKEDYDRIPAAQNDERIAKLLEIAELYRDQLRLDAMALATLQRILDIDPHHAATIQALADTYGSSGRWNDLLGVYSRLVDTARDEGDTARQIEFLIKTAEVWIDNMGAPQRGLEALNEVLGIEPANPDARALIAKIYEQSGDWRGLIELKREAIAACSPEDAAELRIDIARLLEQRLGERDEAIAAWNEILELHGEVPAALDALAQTYEGDGRWDAAAELRQRQIAATKDPEEAIELLLRLASVQRMRLGDEEAALRSFHEVLRLQPGHEAAMETLREAYIIGERWDDLVALYESEKRLSDVVEILYVAADTLELEPRVGLLRRIVNLSRDRLGQPERGLRALERILELQPDNQQVARELLPLYREQGNWNRLIATYEVLLEAADNDDDRLELIAGIRDVALHNLGSASQALHWAARAYAIRPSDEILRAGLESAAERAQEWGELIKGYEERIASDECDDAERLELLDRLAEIARGKLSDDDLAQRFLSKIVDIDPKNESALTTLEEIYSASERWADLAQILQKRLVITPESQRLALLRRIATLQEDKVHDLDGAVATYEAIREILPGDLEVIDSLARIHRERGAWRDLADTLQRRLELMDGSPEQVNVLFELSQIQAVRLRDSQAAVGGFMTILDLDPDHLPTIDALEALRRSDPSCSLTVMRGLLPYYRSIGDRDREAQALEVIVAAETDVATRRGMLGELAAIYDLMGDERKADALRIRLELVALDPPERAVREGMLQAARELGQLDVVARSYEQGINILTEKINQAELDGQSASAEIELRRELRSELATLLRDELDRPLDAERVYLSILNYDEANQDAYDALNELLRARGAHEELMKLYRRRVDVIFDSEEQKVLLDRIIKIARHVLDDRETAIKTAEELLDMIPEDLPTMELLAEMYEESAEIENHYSLEDLLGRWGELVESDEMRHQIACRRAALRMQRLSDAFGAVDLLGTVLAEDPGSLRARQLLEMLLDESDVQLQVAALLEPIYVALHDHRARVRILQVRREKAEELGSIDEATSHLQQIARIQENELNDPEAAFVALAEAYKIDPRRQDLRGELQRLGIELGRLEELVAVWREALTKLEDRTLKTDLLLRAGTLLDDHIRDIDQARQVYAELLDLDPPDVEVAKKASTALVRLHREANDEQALVGALRAHLRFAEDDAEQVKLNLEIAELQEKLGDPRTATESYYAVLDLDPENIEAADALERIFVELEDWDSLCAALRQRVMVTEDTFDQARLWRKVGEIQRDHAQNPHRAVEAFQWIVDLRPSDKEYAFALDAIVRIKSNLEEWGDVEDGLRRLIEVNEEEDKAKADLLIRTADVVGNHLDRHHEAMELLEKALAIDPLDETARRMMIAYLDREDTQDEATRILIPVYEGEHNWEALLDLEERAARRMDVGPDRTRALMKVAQSYEARLLDPLKAFKILCDLLLEALDQVAFPTILAEVTRLGADPDLSDDLLRTYLDAADQLSDSERLLQVLRMAGEVALVRLERHDAARVAFERVLELAPDDTRAFDALEHIYLMENDQDALARLLLARAERCEGDQRDDYLIRAAEIYSGELERPIEAIEAYERLSAEGLGRPRVQEALEPLYERTERYVELAAFLERKIERLSGDAVVETHLRLSTIHREQLLNPEEGLRHFVAALRLDPARAIGTGDLDRYLSDEDIRFQVIELLEPAFTDIQDWPRLIQIQELRLERALDSTERVSILMRIAEIQEAKLMEVEQAYGTYRRVFEVAPENVEARENLLRLANILARVEDYVELISDFVDGPGLGDERDEILAVVREAAELWSRLGQYPRAVPFFERLLDARPDDTSVFPALESVLTHAEMWDRLMDAYWAEADRSFDEGHQVEILMRLAELALGILVDDEAAARAYRRVLEIQPDSELARSALERIFERTEQWELLIELLRDRLERTVDAQMREAVLLRIAELQDSKLDQPESAIDTLDRLFAEIPGDQAAIAFLEGLAERREEQRERIFAILRPLYEAAGDTMRIIAVDEWQLSVTDDPFTRHEIYREIAMLLERMGGEAAGHALQVLLRALQEPGPQGSIEGLDAEVFRLGEALAAMEHVIASMIAAAGCDALADERERRIDLLVKAARYQLANNYLHESVESLRAALQIDEENAVALELLDQGLLMLNNFEELKAVLERRIEVTGDPTERLDLLRRLARLLEDTLVMPEAAEQAWRRLTDIEPSDLEALQRLRNLYQASGSSSELIEVLERLIEVSADPSERRTLRMDLATIQRELMNNRDAEIEVLRSLLMEEPHDEDAMSSLARALIAEERFGEAADVVLERASMVDAPETKAALLLDVARLYAGPMADPFGALAHYESVLQSQPDHQGALADLVTLATQQDYCEAASNLVLPYLERQHYWQELASVYEARSRFLGDTFMIAEALRNLVRIRYERLSDPAGALDAAYQLLDKVPADELKPVLETTARLSVHLDQADEHVDNLGKRSQNPNVDPASRVQMAQSAAEIAEEILGDKARAVALLAPLIEAEIGDEGLCRNVERLARSSGNKELLARALRESARLAEGQPGHADVLVRLADAELDINAIDRAIEAYREALDIHPGFAGAVAGIERILENFQREGQSPPSAIFEALERSYQDAGNLPGMARIVRMRLEAAEGDEFLQMLEHLGRLYEDGGGSREEALDAWGNLLLRDAESSVALERTVALAADRALLGRAIHFMAAAIAAAREQGRPCVELCLATTRILLDDIHDPRTAQKALAPVLDENPEHADALALLVEAGRAAGDLEVLHDALTRYARVLVSPEEAATLWREAAEVASRQGEMGRMKEDIEQLLELDEDDDVAWQ